jgi:hypothetical protein
MMKNFWSANFIALAYPIPLLPPQTKADLTTVLYFLIIKVSNFNLSKVHK